MRSAQLRGTKRINGAVSAFVIVTVIQYMTLVPGLFRPMGGSGEHKGPYPVRTGRRRQALNCNPEINIIWEARIMRTSKLFLLAASVSALSVSTPGFDFQADGQERAPQGGGNPGWPP